MSTASPAETQHVASLRAAERERAELSRALVERWPKAARDVLVIAARAERFNRRAAALGLPQLAAAEPVAAASAMWAVMALSAATVPVRPARPSTVAAGQAGRRSRAAGPRTAGRGWCG